MLSPHPTVRGPIPRHTPLLVEAMREAGCDVVSVGWGRHSDEDSLLARALSRLSDATRVRKLVAGASFDVVVVKTSHEWISMLRDIPMLIATRRLPPPVVLHFHGGRSDKLTRPGFRLFKAASRLVFALCDGVLVLSTEEERAAAAFYPRGAFRTVINPYVPTAAPPPAPRREPAGEVPTILFVGRLIPEKGILDAAEAFATLHARRPCRLLVAGGGPLLDELRRRTRALGVAGDVTLLGHVSAGELRELYEQADVFLLPTYFEGFPTAMTEAMNAGLPVVTTCLRGMADQLVAGEHALFVTPGVPGEITGALERLLDDRELRRLMGEANRRKVNDFAPPVAADRYLRAIEEIVGAGRPSVTARPLTGAARA